MLQTEKSDWKFVIPATVIFGAGLLVAAWDLSEHHFVLRFGELEVIGYVLFTSGILLRRLGRRTLGRSYSYGLKTLHRQQLVQKGIYRHIRHPIYLAAIMYSIGIPIILTSLRGVIIMSGLIVMFLYRIRLEERMLVKKFGDEYREYMSRTARLIPLVY